MKKLIKTGQKVIMDDGKEFIVVASILYNNDNFVYIINSDDDNEQYYGLATSDDNDEIDIKYLDMTDKENDETITNLVKLFYGEAEKFYKENKIVNEVGGE